MAKSVIKLFRDPDCAAKAAEELKSKGFKDNEVVLWVSDSNKAQKLGVKATKDIESALVKVEGLNQEAVQYFSGAASVGAILLSVSADESRIDKAKAIMRDVEFASLPNKFDMWSSSPGFPSAEKMSATNPLDAKMSGDFRKY